MRSNCRKAFCAQATILTAVIVGCFLGVSPAQADWTVYVTPAAQRYLHFTSQGGFPTRAAALAWANQNFPGSTGGMTISGFDSPPETSAPDSTQAVAAAAAQQAQLEAQARDLNDQGLAAYNLGNYAAALKFFQDALEKTPGDPNVAQNVRLAQNQISAKQQNPQLRGLAQDGNSGLRGIGPADSGLRGLAEPGGLKPLPVNPNPMVVDTRNVPSGLEKETEGWLNDVSTAPGVAERLRKGWEAYKANDLNVANAWFEDALNHDLGNSQLKWLVEYSHEALHLAQNPAFNDALNQGVAAAAADDAAGEHTALEKIRVAEGLLVLPRISDMQYLADQVLPPDGRDTQPALGLVQLPQKGDEAFLFGNLAADPPEDPGVIRLRQVLKGTALPDGLALDQMLAAHPERQPALLAAWKFAIDENEKKKDAALKVVVRQLAATAAQLGLPYGHIEETVAEDPALKTAWQAAIRHALDEENTLYLKNPYDPIDDFWNAIHFGSGMPPTEAQPPATNPSGPMVN